MKNRIKRVMVAGGVLALLATGLGQAATLTNSAGATVEILTTAADSGGALSNPAGATLEAVSTDQASADLRAGTEIWAFVGLLDAEWTFSAARQWALYE